MKIFIKEFNSINNVYKLLNGKLIFNYYYYDKLIYMSRHITTKFKSHFIKLFIINSKFILYNNC